MRNDAKCFTLEIFLRRLARCLKCSTLWDTKEDVILTYYIHCQSSTNQSICQGWGFFCSTSFWAAQPMHAQTLKQTNEMARFSELCFRDLIFHF